MKKIRLYVFGYRDQSFWNEYGPIVRDLMMISSLCELDTVDSVTFYNRPITFPELFLRRKKLHYSHVGSKKIIFTSKLSTDIFGPLKRRLWVKNAYKTHYNIKPEFSEDYINVVLDFLPIGDLPEWAYQADMYWYDLIDNFKKHNRYSEAEKEQVSQKYQAISEYAGNKLITGVSNTALSEFSDAQVLENAILKLPQIITTEKSKMFDFGFMGFITNKFDVDAVKEICALGYSVAIYGEFYDKATERELLGVTGAHLFGRFRDSDVDTLLSTFKIGLIPYRNELLHDESPLKLYQYLSASKPALSSFNFDFFHRMFFVYEQKTLMKQARLAMSSYESGSSISDEEKEGFSWDSRIKIAVNEIYAHAL